jgi:putative ABC transport system permease protein
LTFDRTEQAQSTKHKVRSKNDMIHTLTQDIRYGGRMLLKKPAFTVLAILTLALGIGANTAIFSVVNAVLLRSLPYANANELVVVFMSSRGDEPESHIPFSPAGFLTLKTSSRSFSDVAALSNKGWPVNLTNSGEPERLQGFQVSSNLFTLLGINPQSGRTFSPDEDRPGSNHVVVLSNDFWQRRFAGDRGVIGRTLTLNGENYGVIGIMPPDFRFYAKTDVWTPLAFDPKEASESHSNYLEVIARFKPGVTIQQASAETDQVTRAFLNDPRSALHAQLRPPQHLITQEVKPMLLVLLSAVAFVLLIACVNMANLTLARGIVRRRELAVRTALGATRFRVVRQLLIESALLALSGGVVGLLLANWVIRFLTSGLPDYLAEANSRVGSLHVDGTALAFTVALSVITTILFALAPAIQLSRFDLNRELKEGGRASVSRDRFRSALVVTEITLAMITLVGAGLMVKSLWRLVHVNPGYEPYGVLTARIDPSRENYKEDAPLNAFYKQLLERVQSIPGVTDVGIINTLNASTNYAVVEHPSVPVDRQESVQMNQVSSDYFRAMGIPLRRGRVFDDRDVDGATRVILIDESLARKEFPSEDPIGKHLSFWKQSWEVVGVVGGARYWELNGDPVPHMYFFYRQVNWGSMQLVIRTQFKDPMRLSNPVRAELAAIDKNQPIHSFKTLEATVSDLVAPQRFTTLLLASFAGLSALLSAIGIYGVISYSVSQSVRDIGVRMALGAERRHVLSLVLKHGMLLTLIGVALGLIGSYALTRLMSALLFEVKPTDGITYVSVSVGLVAIALVACYIPARRATKIDPLVALKYE